MHVCKRLNGLFQSTARTRLACLIIRKSNQILSKNLTYIVNKDEPAADHRLCVTKAIIFDVIIEYGFVLFLEQR